MSLDLETPENINVLVIDDNPLVHDLIKRALYQVGINNIKCAENAFYGMRLCAEVDFDVVICAFNVKSDRDGFHILEEMQFKGYVTKKTVLIFLSSETSEALVNSVAELQPDDFWVKPLNPKLVQERLAKAMEIKAKLFNVFECFDSKDFGKAVYYVDRFVQKPEFKKYHMNLLKMKGESLIRLLEYKDAEDFYRNLVKEYKLSWIYLGFVNALLKQNKIDEIQQLVATLTEKVETRFAAYDMLAQYYVDNEDYVRAYEEIKKAAALAPRNIARNKKVWDLARLNHDQREQYYATINMAKYAKNSIHDSPELLLNVIRSGVDLATSVDGQEAFELLKQAEAYITELESRYEDAGHFKEQLVVTRARILSAREEKEKAKRLIETQVSLRPTTSLEDNLDKVKIFHELGMREEALLLLESVKKQIACDNLAGAVTTKFVEQEAKERAEIHFTPKQLNSMAVEFFKKKKMAPALKSLEQALQLTPKNVKTALSLLKVLVAIHRSEGLDKDQKDLAKATINNVANSEMDETQTLHFNELTAELNIVIDTHIVDEPATDQTAVQ